MPISIREQIDFDQIGNYLYHLTSSKLSEQSPKTNIPSYNVSDNFSRFDRLVYVVN
jgi:hypothetical protein